MLYVKVSPASGSLVLSVPIVAFGAFSARIGRERHVGRRVVGVGPQRSGTRRKAAHLPRRSPFTRTSMAPTFAFRGVPLKVRVDALKDQTKAARAARQCGAYTSASPMDASASAKLLAGR